jgi:phosphoglycolate phosphatase
MHRLVEAARAIAFDLDGTLVDSAPDLALAANRMLAALGERELAEERVAAAIGEGIDALVARTLAESAGREPAPDRIEEGRKLFRDFYAERVFDRGRVFDGVREGLERLARHRPIGCITNKARPFTEALLAKARLARFLGFLECADGPEQRKPAPFLLLAACRELGIAPRELLYVGDSALDLAAARAAGCPVVLVSYGYHHGRRPEDAGADAVIADIRELASLPPANDARRP